MKVSLVVASGVHQGKVIAITGPQFMIGRDPECQLRPASQAVSKQHCAVAVREGKVYLADFGSTNGTVLNGEIVRGEERAVSDGDSVQVGPIDFVLRIEILAPKEDGTPLPERDPATAAALAAVKAAANANTVGPSRDATPAPSKAAGPAPAPRPAITKPTATGQSGSKESPALPATAKPETSPAAPPASNEEHDRIAAMLLGLADDSEVPEGSTVVDVPAIGAAAAEGKPDEKKDAKKMPTKEDSSNAASEILRKYMRRPK